MKLNFRRFSATFSLVYFISSLALAQTSREVEVRGISVKGNSETPKVLYVVPWQASYGNFYKDKRTINELKNTFDYIEPDFDEKLRYFRKNLTIDIQPFSKN